MPVGTRGLSAEEKILHYITINFTTGCWVWAEESRDSNDYGRIYYSGREWVAHKLSYHIFREPTPKGLELDHLCRNRPCVNPWHLEPVTRRENSNRGLDRYNRPVNSPTCANNHIRTINKTKAGSGCKACNAEASKRYRSKKHI